MTDATDTNPPTGNEQQESGPHWVRLGGLVAGLVAFALPLVLPAPEGVGAGAWTVAAVALLMAVWWMTEAVPLAVTALLPLVLFPVLGIADFKEAAATYAHPLIFLFLGGFMLARAMEQRNLHKRIAFTVLRLGGRSPAALVFSLMAVTAFLSMWVSNTATTMMMLPIGLSIIAALAPKFAGREKGVFAGFAAALMLGIGYAATIGGMGTLIGTPPNALLAGFMNETYGRQIGFAQWMIIGIPVVVVLLPVTWLVLTRVAFRRSFAGPAIESDLPEDGHLAPEPLTRGEVLVAIVISLTALAWITRPMLAGLLPGFAITDSGIAIAAAVLLMILPESFRTGRPLLAWSEAVKLRWDVLILFGGGLALADAMGKSGLMQAIAGLLANVGHMPLFWFVLLVMIVVVYLGELASNTAMAAIFLPISGAIAAAIGADPIALALPVALAASLGFMLPVATPPNAIVYGSNAFTIGQMIRAGAILDVACILLVAILAALLGGVVTG